MKISLCVITLNEEEGLRRCLASCRDVVDEIVVVDSGSTDNTRLVAQDYGAKFFYHPWRGYVEQKNYAINLATNEWILSLDADEELSPALIEEIKSLKNSDIPDSVSGFSMPRCVYYEGKFIRHGDWYPDRIVRLFRKSRSRFEGGKVHERIVVDGEIKRLRGDIYHYSFKDESEQIEKMYRYARLWAETQYEKKRRVYFISPYLNSLFRWFRGYILRLGFLDGRQGAKIAMFCAMETFLKYRFLIDMQKNRSRRGENL